MRLPIILDTDPGIDDAAAIARGAVRSPSWITATDDHRGG